MCVPTSTEMVLCAHEHHPEFKRHHRLPMSLHDTFDPTFNRSIWLLELGPRQGWEVKCLPAVLEYCIAIIVQREIYTVVERL